MKNKSRMLKIWEVYKKAKLQNIVRVFLLTLLILPIVIKCQKQQIEWKGTIEEVDDIIVMKNPKEPIYTEDVLILEEELSIGEKEGREEYMFSQIRDIAVDEEENIYVLDLKEPHIKVFDRNGSYLRTLGRKGQGPGEIGMPTFISVTAKNEILVEDPMNRRLSYYSTDGSFIISVSTAKRTILQAKTDSLGNILGAGLNIEKQAFEISKFDPDYNYICSFGSDPVSRDTEAYNPFKTPMRWTVLQNDHVMCGYPENYELQIFNPEGKTIKRIYKEYDPVEISQKEIAEAKKGMRPGRRLEVPKHHSSFIRFTITDEGRIFIQTREITGDRERYYYDVFDRDGRYIAKIPLKMRPRIWKRNQLYTIEEDEEGYQIVKRYKVYWNI